MVINTQAVIAVSQGYTVITGKLMQPVGLQVNSVLFVNVIHKVAANTSQNAVRIVFAYVNAIAGKAISFYFPSLEP